MRDVALLLDAAYVSELCRSDSDVDHARCRHASNRARMDGCGCRCHEGGSR